MIDNDLDIRAEMIKQFKCTRCNSNEGKIIVASFTDDISIGRLLNIQNNETLAIFCKQCGYTEFYDRKILSGFKGFAL